MIRDDVDSIRLGSYPVLQLIKNPTFKWLFKDLRDRELLRGGCARCDVKYACGGCRSMAYAYYNGYLESDPTCLYNKGEYDERGVTECGTN